MPELSRFNGMVIYMQFYDTKHHNKPHIHVYYGDFEASVGIDGELMAGSLPRKQLVFIQAWLALHEEEAYAAWNKAVQGLSLIHSYLRSGAGCRRVLRPKGNVRPFARETLQPLYPVRVEVGPVSYTHLDVYKRQVPFIQRLIK